MLKQPEKYELLAFATLVRLKRSTGVLEYKNENSSNKCKELHMSYPKYKKLKKQCLNLGILNESKNGHLMFIGVSEILNILNEGIDIPGLRFNKHLKFYNKVTYVEDVKFKTIVEQIRDSFCIINFSRQDFKIRKNQEMIDTYNLSTSSNKVMAQEQRKRVQWVLKKLSKLARQANMSTEDFVKRLEENNNGIITGKYHIANLLGMSSSTGSRILNSLENKGIKREKIIHRINMEVNQESFLALKSMYNGVVIPSKYKNHFMIYEGSRIYLDNYSNSRVIENKLPLPKKVSNS